MPANDPYVVERRDFGELLLRKFYPERTDKESGVIREFLTAHHEEYDRFQFSVRVGQGVLPNPEHLAGVQRSTAWSSRKRIDVLAWRGDQPTIIEVKERVQPAVLGQLQAYQHLFVEDHPESEVPKLIAIGRYSDDDTLRVLAANGIDVFLYDPGENG